MQKDACAPDAALVERLRAGVVSDGFAATDAFVPQTMLARLREEARAAAGSASRATGRGGVAYRASIAPLGPLASELLFGDALLALLTAVAGTPVAASTERSCLTIYRSGDRLGPHLDEPESECWFTAILYLEAESTSPVGHSTGLELRIYAKRPTARRRPRLVIPTVAGRLVVGRGARVWHERPPLRVGERVMALTACYREQC
jgi:hypothetical protein